MLRSLLRGHTVIAHPYMWQALQECKKTKFDLVLLDLALLDTKADETLKRVTEFRALGSNKILVITGSRQYDEACRALGLKVLHKDASFVEALAKHI